MVSYQHEKMLMPSPLAIAHAAPGPSLASLSSSASQGRFFGATMDGMATLASSMRPVSAGGGTPSSDPFAAHELLGASLAGHSSPLRPPAFRTCSSVGQLPKVPPPWEAAVRKAFPLITRRDIKVRRGLLGEAAAHRVKEGLSQGCREHFRFALCSPLLRVSAQFIAT